MHNTDPVQRRTLIGRLKLFRDRLLNIDTRNRSIFLRGCAKKHSFDLATLPASVCDDALKKALSGAGEALLLPDRAEGEDAEARRTHLVGLMRAAQSEAEETGLQELYVGVCWVEGGLDDERCMRAPLVLAPAAIRVKRDGRRQGIYVVFQDQGEARLNRAALAAVRKFRHWTAPDDLADKLAELLEGKDAENAEAFHAAFNRLLGEIGAPFEAGAYAAGRRLEKLPAADLKARGRTPLKTAGYAVLGLFPQSSTALFADFEELIRRAEQGRTDQGIVDNLLEAPADRPEVTPASPDLDGVSDARLNCVLPSDPSQDAILLKAAKADCTVVRGPPGTGKSQVIVNLVSDALSRDERVLIVCQKRAALDVVYDRLCSVGLTDAAYLVHDEGADRTALYRKMAGVLAGRGSPPPAPPSPRPAAGLSTTIDELVAAIRAIVVPLGSDRHGIPAYRLYRRARRGFKSILTVPEGVLRGDEKGLSALCAFVEKAKAGAVRFDRKGYPLAHRSGWAGLGHADRQRLIDAFHRLAEAARAAGDGPVVLLEPDAEYDRAAAAVKTAQSAWRFVSPGWWFGGRARYNALLNRLSGLPPTDWDGPLRHGRAVARALAELSGRMTPAWKTALSRRLTEAGGAAKVAAWADGAATAVEADFHDLQAHDALRTAAGPDADAVLAECAAKLPPESDWGAHVLAEVNFRWIDELERLHPALSADPFARYEDLRSRLVELLRAKRETLARDLACEHRRRALTPEFAPGARVGPNRKASTDWNKLAYEVEKKRRLKPLRALLAEFARPMRQTAAVWLASPEVVAEVFPLERGLFDLVIFDEASQLAVERAVPVVYRGARVVIAGDEQQMPPSHLFQARADEDDDEEESDVPPDESAEAESLLMLAKRIYGFDYLSWHYRSRYPDLIEFSNHAYYEGRLTVGAAVERASSRTPIEWVRVNGVWSGRTNAVEVARAVDTLAALLTAARDEAFRSVGIITFNEPQQEAILDEIDRRRAADPAFAELMNFAENPRSGKTDDKPFVKNIENVQGDERDVIVFSVGYAPGPDKVFRRQFGSLSTAGGENRLNVAVTRARERMIVICSFDPHELAVDDVKSTGTRRLRRFLEYARAVGTRRPQEVEKIKLDLNPAAGKAVRSDGDGRFESAMEETIAAALTESGYTVEPRVGVGEYRLDLAVADPARPDVYCLGIECDGSAFHSGRSVRERDAARAQFLEGRGWKLARVWGRNWWLAAERELERIKKSLPPTGSKA
jgi:very-short-patch-repair endonuclease